MTRPGKVMASEIPHHITHRRSRWQETGFCTEGSEAYLDLMGEWCRSAAVEIWAYCLLPKHDDLIAVWDSVDGFRRAIGGSPGG